MAQVVSENDGMKLKRLKEKAKSDQLIKAYSIEQQLSNYVEILYDKLMNSLCTLCVPTLPEVRISFAINEYDDDDETNISYACQYSYIYLHTKRVTGIVCDGKEFSKQDQLDMLYEKLIYRLKTNGVSVDRQNQTGFTIIF